MEDDNKTRELLFEYEQLRKEILGNFTLQLQILGGTVTFVAVIMTLGFSEALKSPLAKAALFFVGEAIALIGLMQTMGLAHSTFQIASYLRVFTEDELRYVKWETRLQKFRNCLGNLPYEEVTGSVRYTYAFIILIDFILGCFYALLDVNPDFQLKGSKNLYEFIWGGLRSSPLTGAFIAIALLTTVYLLRVAWRQYRTFVLKHEETYTSRWNAIKASEKDNRPQAKK